MAVAPPPAFQRCLQRGQREGFALHLDVASARFSRFSSGVRRSGSKTFFPRSRLPGGGNEVHRGRGFRASRISRCRRSRSMTRSWCSPSRPSSAFCSDCPRSPSPGTRSSCRWSSTSWRRSSRRRLSGAVFSTPEETRRSPGFWRRCSRSLVALLATLVLLFGFQGEQILRQPAIIGMLAAPILLQVYFNAGFAYLLNRMLGEQHCVAAPSALIGASNFFELAVAAAISLFGLEFGRGSRDRRGRPDRSAGHAERRLDRERQQRLVRGGIAKTIFGNLHFAETPENKRKAHFLTRARFAGFATGRLNLQGSGNPASRLDSATNAIAPAIASAGPVSSPAAGSTSRSERRSSAHRAAS